jgi:predicted nucleic acid-binding protein
MRCAFPPYGLRPFFAEPIEAVADLIVPVISLYEVFKRVLQQRDEGAALQAVALMRQGRVVDLSETLALSAARLSAEHRLPMADSLMLATARRFEATLWTQDKDFEGIAGVRLRAKTPGET